VDDHVALPANITLQGTATFCAFARYFDDGTGNLPSGARMLDWGNANGDNIFFGNLLTSRDFRFETRNVLGQDANAVNVPQLLTAAIGYWAHFCSSVDGQGSKRVYMNGVLVAGPTAPQVTSLNTTIRNTNYFGRSNNISNAFFRGGWVCLFTSLSLSLCLSVSISLSAPLFSSIASSTC
jgi:hypothetical protein